MGKDYPRTLMDFERRFHDEGASASYFSKLRWPTGWVCPRCEGRESSLVRRNRWRCGQCRYEVPVSAGTLFQDSHLPVTTWFRAMGYVTNQNNGVSALGLQRVLGLGSYKTAWARHSASPPRGRAPVGERKQSYDRTIGVR